MKHSQVKAFVLDDSIKARRGKKMEDVSSHYDHTTNRHVMGQQVLTLGLATEEAFLPLDSQIYVSSKKAQALNRPYEDRRSIAAQRYREATTRTKPQMALAMMKRAKRCGVEADYLVADAWFGTKTMVRAADEVGVCAVLQMKKGAMKYRVHAGEGEAQRLDAKEIFAHQVTKRWRKVRGLPWRAVAIDVELDVSETGSQPPQWKRVRLLFVRGVHEPGEPEVGKKDWALFLCTDHHALDEQDARGLRPSVGHRGVLQGGEAALGVPRRAGRGPSPRIPPSIHLCAIRYLMLVHAKLDGEGAGVAGVRADIRDQLNLMSFAARLWQIFRAIISGTLDELGDTLGCSAQSLMKAFDEKVNRFFTQSLQLDVYTMRARI